MELFMVVLACLIAAAAFKPNGNLCNFDSKATVPLRGLLAIMIILHHLALYYKFDECIGSIHVSPIYYFKEMGLPLVAAFFFITGYGLSKSLQAKGFDYLSGFLKRRLGKVLPEFLIFTVLVLLISDVAGLVSLSEAAHNMAKGSPPLRFSWFIYAIVYVYIAFYMAALASHADGLRTGLLLSLLIVPYLAATIVLGWGCQWYRSIPAVSIGFFVALYERKITELLSRRYVLLCLAVCTFVCVFIMDRMLCSRLISAIMFAVAVYVCMRLYRIKPYPILILLGEVSLYIYLVHGTILQVVRSTTTNRYVAIVVVVLASVAVSVLIKGIRGFVENREFRVYSKNRA